MKVLTVGDIHLKPWILDNVDNAIEKHNPDKVILLGDYFDDWDSTILDYKNMSDRLDKFIIKHGDKIVLMYGNHELSYLLPIHCSGYNYYVKDIVRDFCSRYKLNYIFETDNIYWSHAGITQRWYDIWIRPDNNKNDWNSNGLRQQKWNSAGPMRGGNDTPSPLWADMSELIDDPWKSNKCKSQIVGHSPISEHVFHNNIVFCDTLSKTSKYDMIEGKWRYKFLLTDTKTGEHTLVE